MNPSAFLLALAAIAAPAGDAKPSLTVVAESHEMIWNAVVVEREQVFVGGPRWTGSKGPALGRLDEKGAPKPFPDASWNNWAPGRATEHAFVNVNAVHRGPDGSLWVIDTGAPDFGGDPLPGGAKVVQIDPATARVVRIYPLGRNVALPKSYVDDIRINGRFGYLTDAGRPGLIVLDLETGKARRVLDEHTSTQAPKARRVVVAGSVVKDPEGKPLSVNADPMELSPDGKWFYFGPLEGPWSRIETRYLDDASLTAQALAQKVEPWADLPPMGGSAMAPDGTFYFTDLAKSAIVKRSPDGALSTVIQDDRLHWVDAPFLDDKGDLWLPIPQMDRAPLFQGGASKVKWPIQLLHLRLPKPQ